MTRKRLITAFRLLFGAFFLFGGMNYFFFDVVTINLPPDQIANVLFETMTKSGMFNIAKVVEALTGILLLLDMFVPLALVVAFPVTVVIVFFDVCLTGVTIYAAAGVMAFVVHVGLLLGYLRYYRPMLAFRAAL